MGRLENAIGWYHSHPGYGCWLSGIDVSTQMLNQQFQEPFVAIVVSRNNLIHLEVGHWHLKEFVFFKGDHAQYNQYTPLRIRPPFCIVGNN